MAYTQAPGRGNKPKTGNGLPSALLQKKQEDIEIADNETLDKAFTSMNRTDFSGSGVTGNAKTGEFKANPFETTYVKGKNKYLPDFTIKDNKPVQRSSTSNTSTENISTYDYNNKNKPKSSAQLYSGFKNDSTMTMNRRNAAVEELRKQYKQTKDYMTYAGEIDKAVKNSKTVEKKKSPNRMNKY